jgi:protocatechuate 3,4-dioxygenase beta subunit
VTLRLAGVLLAAALAASAQAGGSVQGRVISSLHGEPVPNALVTLRQLDASGTDTAGRDQPRVYICQTGADGRFSLAGVPPGLYAPRPSKQGYGSLSLNRAAVRDFPPITVEAGKPVMGLDLSLTPDSVIAGRVLDADGDPVRYAMVEVQQYVYVAGKRQLQSMHQVQTNDRGEYRIFYLAPGRYYLHAQATQRSSRRNLQANEQVRGTLPLSTLASAYYPGVADPARATELQTLPGAELDGIDLSLKPEKRYAIRGKLPAADPATSRRGVRVVERSDNQQRPQYSMMMTGHDSYEVRDLTPGSYLVIGDGSNPANPEEREYARQPVDIVDRDVDGVDLVFSPGVRMTGTVKVEGAAPVENLALLLQSTDLANGQQQAKVAADGTFTSMEMAPGIYEVRLPARNAYLKSVRVGDQEAVDRKIDTEHLSGPVTVVVGVDFGRVDGTVTDDAGKPVSNANVTLIPNQSLSDWRDRFRNGVTNTAGKFTLNNVQPGEYRVFAWVGAEPGAPQSADFRKPYEERGTPVKVEANGRQSLDLKPIILPSR